MIKFKYPGASDYESVQIQAELNDERAKLGIKQCRDLFDAKTQMTSKIDNVLL
jgi:hypothetical protein